MRWQRQEGWVMGGKSPQAKSWADSTSWKKKEKILWSPRRKIALPIPRFQTSEFQTVREKFVLFSPPLSVVSVTASVGDWNTYCQTGRASPSSRAVNPSFLSFMEMGHRVAEPNILKNPKGIRRDLNQLSMETPSCFKMEKEFSFHVYRDCLSQRNSISVPLGLPDNPSLERSLWTAVSPAHPHMQPVSQPPSDHWGTRTWQAHHALAVLLLGNDLC